MKAAQLNEDRKVWIQEIPQAEFYSIQEVCTILHVGGPSVYGAVRRGTLRGVRVNGVAHVRHEALLNYINRRKTAPMFDSGELVVEDIVPEKEAAKAASSMARPAPPGADAVNEEFDFLGE